MKIKTGRFVECAAKRHPLRLAQHRKVGALVLSGVLLAFQVLAEDSYFSLPLSSLDFTKGALPKRTTGYIDPQLAASVSAYAVLVGEGEIFIQEQITQPWERTQGLNEDRVVIRTPALRDISGRLFLPNSEYKGMVSL